MGKPGGRGKKKNAGVGVDFKKAKHRVGKKLPRAQNQTDTSFKARTLSLAEQSVATDKAGQAVSTRNLTLKELLGQCGHYSERVRRDALAGLGELLAAHPDELKRHSTLVMEAAAERVTDGDAGVRAALRSLLRDALLPRLGGAALAPFVPFLMAHVCAAMTHLAEPIRADALGFLELVMGARPDLVARGYLAPVLQHFGDLLSRGSRGRSIKAGSLASLQGVALALERFLSRAVAALGSGGEGEKQEAAAEEEAEEAEEGHTGVLAWRRCRWVPGGGATAAAAAEGAGGAAAGADEGAAAAAALLGHLLDCWSEAGPSQLAEAPELVAAQSLTALARSCDLLLSHWGASLAGSPHERGSRAAALLARVAPHFPVQRPAVKVAAPLADQLVQLNVAAAQLLARFLPTQAAAAAAAQGGGGGAWEAPWVARLLDWFVGVMADGAALPASEDALFGEAPAAAPASGAKRQRGSGSDGLPASVYQSALDCSLAVLPQLPPARRQQLLGAAWQLWQRSSARSSARPRLLAFWAALLRDPAAAFYQATPGGGPLVQHAEAATWLVALPRYLFELGPGSPAASGAALRLLLGAARSAPASSALAASLQEAQPQLAPLWAVLLPAGKQPGAAPRLHVGPLAGAPPALQGLAADLLFHFPSVSDQVLRAAALVCLCDAYPPSTAARLLEVLGARAAGGGADPAAFCGLLLNALSGASAAGLRCGSWARHEQLVGAACQAALRLGTPEAAAAALMPPLLALAGGSCGASSGGDDSSGADASWAAYGLLQLSAVLAAAAAAAQQQWQPAGAAAIPHLMLRLHSACQKQEQQQQQQQQQPVAGGLALSSTDAAALCLRLLLAQPRQLLPALLAAVASGAAGSGGAAEAAAEAGSLLPAALALMLAMLREARLHAALLEARAGMAAALAACRAACEAAGDASHGGRACQEQLRQLEALCTAVLGT